MRWIFLIPVWAVVNILAMLFSPILALLHEEREGICDNGTATRTEPRLYRWLWWFQTPDNSLLGDGAWQIMEPDHWEWRSKFSGWPRLQTYFGRVGWLMRNPAYGFERIVLAAVISEKDIVYVSGDVTIKDGVGGKAGYCFVRIGAYWNLLWIKSIYGARCIYCNFGWNLKTFAEDSSRLSADSSAQYVFSPRFSTIDK